MSEEITPLIIGSCQMELSLAGAAAGRADMVPLVSIFVDPPAILASGELYARALPESAQGGTATVAGALTLATFWGGVAAFWFDHPRLVPFRKALGYSSGRELMLRFPLPERSRLARRRARRRRDDAVALAVFASYPLWLWLGWDHGRRARPRSS
jgi:hypothetical protein